MNVRLLFNCAVAASMRSSASALDFARGGCAANRTPRSKTSWRGFSWAAALLVVSTATGCAFGRLEPENDWAEVKRTIRERFPDVRQMSTADLDALLADPAAERPVLVDVRSREEYDVSHLRGALRAESEDEALDVLALEPLDRPIVVYCSVGYRSSMLAESLAGAGYTNVANLEGSLFAWANEGRPVVDDSGPVRVVHPYDNTWGRLLDRSLWPEAFPEIARDPEGASR